MKDFIQDLHNRNLISPPAFLPANLVFVARGGSYAYGCQTSNSDMDIYGVTVPPPEVVFPHLAGYIDGFGSQQQKFHQWHEHNIIVDDVNYDFNIWGIVQFFHLTMMGNPNMIDVLFVPQDCVLYSTPTYAFIRFHKEAFLSKQIWPKFQGYAYNHLASMKRSDKTGKRAALVAKYGYDTKDAYNLVRSLFGILQIIKEGTLNYRVHKDFYNDVRNGKFKYEEIVLMFDDKVIEIKELLPKCGLPDKADEQKIKSYLIECLHQHWDKG